jgi:hypothetical protein
MLSDQVKRRQAQKRFPELPTTPAKEKDYEIGAAAAYDAQEADLITKTRKTIAASNRALREAETVLKGR